MNLKTVEIKELNQPLNFEFLEWDTDFFSIPCYRLDPNSQALLYPIDLDKTFLTWLKKTIIQKLGTTFCSVKLKHSTDSSWIEALMFCGFKFVGTEITFMNPNNTLIKTNNTSFNVEVLKKEDILQLPSEELGSVFTETRFHKDNEISKGKADSLWIQLIKNFIPSPTQKAYACLSDNKIGGLFLVKHDIEQEAAYLMSVAILPEFAGKGLGTHLIETVLNDLHNTPIYAGTQASNRPAMNFYLKSGFNKIYDTSTMLHGWLS